jgi:hypothetical protein
MIQNYSHWCGYTCKIIFTDKNVLKAAYIKVRASKFLSNAFNIQNGLKQVWFITIKCAIRKHRENP